MVWLFRESLTQAGAVDGLFNRFDATLRNAGYLRMSDQIRDATSMAAPKQRNANDEKADLPEGWIPQDWQDKPAKLSHKETRSVVRAAPEVHEREATGDGIMSATDMVSRSLVINRTSPSTGNFG